MCTEAPAGTSYKCDQCRWADRPLSGTSARETLVNVTIDSLDARLIAVLRANPRIGLLEVARQLGVARGTVQARLAKLESRGVITGHGPEVDPWAMGYRISAFMLIELAQGRLGEAVACLDSIPGGLEGDAPSGPHAFIRRVVAPDPEHLQELVNNMLATPAIQERRVGKECRSRWSPYY